jgi:hypothetical protein
MILATDKKARTEFSTLSYAAKYVNESSMTLMIVLGDNNKFWTLRPKHANELIKNGYSRA